MYTRFYNLTERPFELTPDPRYLFLSSRHREALAHLTYAVEERRGFVQLTGEIGTGKTMILDALVLGLDARTKVARLSHTTISEDELFELLVREFGLEHRGGGKLERLSEIQEFLDEWTAAGRNSVLVVDEAQNLSLPVLEEIRLLSNLRSQGKCSLQIVLAGQPEFRTRLDQEDLRQLKQRIGIRYHLTPLSAGETGEYVAHRMNVAGATGSTIFDRGAVDAVFAYAGGVPRMINIICDRALVAGYGANRRRIGKALILETVEDIEGVEFGAARAAASDEPPPMRVGEVADAPPSRPVLAATPGAVQEAARIAPNATEAA
ncbi:AAA family ATPase, partial [bacterium]|nr:AAA family ATPase [bacterium]